MPPRRHRYDEAIKLAPWVEEIDNACLRETVTEALVARRSAVAAHGDEKIIAAGDRTLERIEYGRDVGEIACRKAALPKKSRARLLSWADGDLAQDVVAMRQHLAG